MTDDELLSILDAGFDETFDAKMKAESDRRRKLRGLLVCDGTVDPHAPLVWLDPEYVDIRFMSGTTLLTPRHFLN